MADDILAGTERVLRPPPRLSLSAWADEHFYLSPESSAEPGPWHTLPYQRGVMDAITDPDIERVTWRKSARVGATKIMVATVGYFMHQDPCPILLVQPTIEDAQGFSKEEIAPMFRDCQAVAEVAATPAAKSSDATMLHKSFRGGVLSMVGANSARGFRRVSRRVVIFDEVDGYPPSAGSEGDQIRLGIKRTEYFWNRKIVAASTPLIAGISRIDQMFDAGDQRHYHLPCPQCGHFDILAFRGKRGHLMRWPDGKPEEAYFVCSKNGCVIEERDKRKMLELGEWRADAPFRGHASFHIWAAYSLSPNARWGQIAEEFREANQAGPEALKVFVNTVLGESWQERGEAPDYERLYLRREPYAIGSVPAGVLVLTAGVDVQKDRFVFEVVGWKATKESFSIDAGVLVGDTSDPESWARLDGLLMRVFPGEDGKEFLITMLAIDSGYNTQQVYNWGRGHAMSRVIACKGSATETTLVGVPTAVDVTVRGRRYRRGYRVWPIGVGLAKSELYGWLRLQKSGTPGYCHFPEYAEEFFKQLTAEHLVTVKNRKGRTKLEWQVLPNRENHWLDTRVLARAAASVLGIDLAQPPPSTSTTSTSPQRPRPTPPPPARQASERRPWILGSRNGRPWMSKRR